MKSIFFEMKKGMIQETLIISNGKEINCPSVRFVSSCDSSKNNLLN